MKISVLLVLLSIVAACNPSPGDSTIQSTIVFISNGHSVRFGNRKEVEFYQTVSSDSVYTLTYIREEKRDSNDLRESDKKELSKGEWESKRVYSYHHRYTLFPDTNRKIQLLVVRDSLRVRLNLDDYKEFLIAGKKYPVYKFASALRADDYCVGYHTDFWCPDFGIILSGLVFDYGIQSSGSQFRKDLEIDNKERNKILSILKREVWQDKDFYHFRGFSDNAKRAEEGLYGRCTYAPQIDNPFVIDSLHNYIRKQIKYSAVGKSIIKGSIYSSVTIDTTGKIELGYYPFADSAKFGKNYKKFEEECLRIIKGLPQWEPVKYQNKPVPAYITIYFDFTTKK